MRNFVLRITFVISAFFFSLTHTEGAFAKELTLTQQQKIASHIKDSPEQEYWQIVAMLSNPDRNLAAPKKTRTEKFFSALIAHGLVERIELEEPIRQTFDRLYVFFIIPESSLLPIVEIMKIAQPQNVDRLHSVATYQLGLYPQE